MSKTIKVLSIVLLIFSFIINFYGVYASDINMNLGSGNELTSQVTSNSNVEDNLVQTTPTNDVTTATEHITSTITDSDVITPPSSIGSVAEEGLGVSNILSILLITVGVILILLAIAIIIRLK